MKPILITVGEKRPLIVIPESDAHMDGHPVLTYTYLIFRNKESRYDGLMLDTENMLGPSGKQDPCYMGYITFEEPGKLFSYTADGRDELTSREVEEIIEQISEYRDSPQMWSI